MSSVDLAGLSGVFSSLQRLSNIDRHLWSVNLASCTPHITLARTILIYNRVFGCVQSSTRVHGMVVPCEMCHCQRGCQSISTTAKLALPIPKQPGEPVLGSFIPSRKERIWQS